MGKPALAALLDNAYHMQIQEDRIAFFFDASYQNLIPMLTSELHFPTLCELTHTFLKTEAPLEFEVGQDPRLAVANQAQEKLLQAVQADPKIQFILEKFNGSIIKCAQISKEDRDFDD